jgi:glucosamine-phosphate N-acetyltransferase
VVEEADARKGLLETLQSLSQVGALPPVEARRIIRALRRNAFYHVFVAATDDGDVVGATTLLVEQKVIHRGGRVGHVEDVAVREGYQGRGVGSALVKAALEKAREEGCYKVILDSKEDTVGFYEKLGFRRHEVGMRIDLKPA